MAHWTLLSRTPSPPRIQIYQRLAWKCGFTHLYAQASHRCFASRPLPPPSKSLLIETPPGWRLLFWLMGPTVPSYVLFCSVDCAKDMAISIKCRNHYMRLVLGRERSDGFAPIVGYSRWISDRLNSDITIPVIPALSDNGYHLSSSIDSNIALRRRTKT